MNDAFKVCGGEIRDFCNALLLLIAVSTCTRIGTLQILRPYLCSNGEKEYFLTFCSVCMNWQEVTIYTCVLGPYVTLFGQGADLTGGIYLRPPQIGGLLQYLMVSPVCIFLVNFQYHGNC